MQSLPFRRIAAANLCCAQQDLAASIEDVEGAQNRLAGMVNALKVMFVRQIKTKEVAVTRAQC